MKNKILQLIPANYPVVAVYEDDTNPSGVWKHPIIAWALVEDENGYQEIKGVDMCAECVEVCDEVHNFIEYEHVKGDAKSFPYHHEDQLREDAKLNQENEPASELSFRKILRHLLEGRVVTRNSWMGKRKCKYIGFSEEGKLHEHYQYTDSEGSFADIYQLTHEDMCATDWVITAKSLDHLYTRNFLYEQHKKHCSYS